MIAYQQVQIGVFGQVRDTKSALTENRDDLVPMKLVSGMKCVSVSNQELADPRLAKTSAILADRFPWCWRATEKTLANIKQSQ